MGYLSLQGDFGAAPLNHLTVPINPIVPVRRVGNYSRSLNVRPLLSLAWVSIRSADLKSEALKPDWDDQGNNVYVKRSETSLM